jgi:hypothetical protein
VAKLYSRGFSFYKKILGQFLLQTFFEGRLQGRREDKIEIHKFEKSKILGEHEKSII